ncbi:MAG TPA: branched-chain amino acid ABC transporter permease [Actinomycetota bacterium]|nr:branched-chain amino acid ABC transporter permease [Actinomycetota bacterium]
MARPQGAATVEAPRALDVRRVGVARWAHWAVVAAVAVVLWVVPLFTGEYFVGLLGRFLIFGLVAMSLDLVWGYTGQLSLGHAAFFGLGAYTAGLILAKASWPALGPLALILGILLPAALGLVMAGTLFYGRVVGAYFAIITLLVSLILEQLAVSLLWLTGGINGLYGMEPLALGPISFDTLNKAYYLVVVVVVITYVLAKRLVDSPFGKAMDAVRVNEKRTASLGYSTAAVRTIAFTIGAAIAGLAGVLYVPLEEFVYPSQLGVAFSTLIIVWLAIGGRRSLVGAFIGAFVINYGQTLLSERFQQYWVLATGIFLLLVVLIQPDGLLGMLRDVKDRLVRRRRTGEGDA